MATKNATSRIAFRDLGPERHPRHREVSACYERAAVRASEAMRDAWTAGELGDAWRSGVIDAEFVEVSTNAFFAKLVAFVVIVLSLSGTMALALGSAVGLPDGFLGLLSATGLVAVSAAAVFCALLRALPSSRQSDSGWTNRCGGGQDILSSRYDAAKGQS